MLYTITAINGNEITLTPQFPVNGHVDTWNVYLNKKPHDSK